MSDPKKPSFRQDAVWLIVMFVALMLCLLLVHKGKTEAWFGVAFNGLLFLSWLGRIVVFVEKGRYLR